jgi:hypothetical protein
MNTKKNVDSMGSIGQIQPMPKPATVKELRVRIDDDLVPVITKIAARDRLKAPRVVNQIIASYIHPRRK